MLKSAYTEPVIINEEGTVNLKRVSFSRGDEFDYNENWLQEFLFNHPQTLPVQDIDSVYEDIIPLCREISTPAGPLDCLYVTPQGKLVILEAKLWRNPEARRKVVAQVLDYAKEFNRWSYEDLQREVSQSVGRKGNVVYEVVQQKYPETRESDFVDNVSRCLLNGDFLLLIVGDGIQEGTQHIADFMNEVGRLQFTLGLIEVALFQLPDSSLLVQPRILAKTVIIERAIVELRGDDLQLTYDGDSEDSESGNDSKEFFTEFWSSFLAQLSLDDVGLPHSTATAQNLYFYPGENKQSWISAYMAESVGRIGVYFRIPKGEYGQMMYDYLLQYKDQITDKISDAVIWEDEGEGRAKYITLRKNMTDTRDPTKRQGIYDFFGEYVNRFNNVLRPLLKGFEP